jgi:hypothetical protein
MTHVAWRHQLFLVPNHLCDPVGREARSGRRLLLSLPPSVLPLQASGSLGNYSTIEGYFYLHRQQKGADCNKNGYSSVEAPSVEVKNEASWWWLYAMSICHDFVSCRFLFFVILLLFSCK